MPEPEGYFYTFSGDRCTEEFGPGLGPDYRCLLNVGHTEWHIDQYGNQWSN